MKPAGFLILATFAAMFSLRPLFNHRFGPVLVLTIIICSIGFLTRCVLFYKTIEFAEPSFLHVVGIFSIGLFYDFVVSCFFAVPIAVYCWLVSDNWYRSKWQRISLFTLFTFFIMVLVIVAGSEIAFWQEFYVRFNFIAVDYLVFTNEVIGSVLESY